MESHSKKPKPPKSKLFSAPLFLFLILLLAFVLRLYKLNSPLADWHSWRQADTASVTREYVKNGIDLLRPRYHDVSSIPSGLDNPQGFRMVEFPLLNGMTAFLYNLIPTNLKLHVFSRLVSIVFSLGSLIFLYLITAQYLSQKTALISALIFAVLPYNIYYSRAILPEVPLVFFSLAAIYFMICEVNSGKKQLAHYFWLSALFAAIALLLKPYAIFLLPPLFYLGFRHQGLKVLKDKSMFLFAILTLTPLILWRLWIGQFPEGIPAFTWLLNGNGIRFKGAFFRWIFAERLGKLILGFWGLILFTFGLIKKTKNWFFHWWLIGLLLYLTVFATGNVQHDYYQIILIPIISVFLAKGVVFLLEAPKKYNLNLLTCYLLLVTSVIFMLAFSWFEVRGFFNINNPAIVEAGQAIDSLVEEDALVIAPYEGDAAFLYQTNRRGWPVGGEIQAKIEKGADYYVTTNFNKEAQQLMSRCQILDQKQNYIIISLTGCN